MNILKKLMCYYLRGHMYHHSIHGSTPFCVTCGKDLKDSDKIRGYTY